jgi:sec-independent protein translocase protein TatA
MLWRWVERRMKPGRRSSSEQGHMLYAALGPLEIALIVVAVVVVFGVGKLSQVGGALGKSIREFRKEKEQPSGDVPKLSTRQTHEESSSQPEAKTTEESKN